MTSRQRHITELQAEWILDKGVEAGCLVQLAKEWVWGENEFYGDFADNLKVGDIFQVMGSEPGRMVCMRLADETLHYLPYFALTYLLDLFRSFESAKEFSPYRDSWFVHNDSGTHAASQVTHYDDNGVVVNGDFFLYDDFLELFRTEKGFPAGVRK